ncbi:MAG: type II toxin-antitoxin system PemK/MazF family toxin [Calothrix sp. FI2-JRJ7]|nr:type II toxin-antitoxin system PemK/MazF family toxin [Calothrix sp. FI2-JRJ7]OKH54268.1 PemK-like protein [Calothrix sp. HK-06]
MKGKVVLVSFPLDDLSSIKARPAVCLTNPVGANQHITLALITSMIPCELLETDIVINTSHPDFPTSGLHKASTIRLDHLITLRQSLVLRELGEFSLETQQQILDKLLHFLRA